MKRRVLRRLGFGLCAALSGIIFLELVIGGPNTEAVAPDAGRLTANRLVSASASTRDPQANVSTILDRPLFETGRRFPVAAAALLQSPPPEEKPKQVRLMGVVVISNARLALFQVEGSDKPILAGPGEQIAGSTIERISYGLVVLRGADGVHTLKPAASPPPAESSPGGGTRSELDPPS